MMEEEEGKNTKRAVNTDRVCTMCQAPFLGASRAQPHLNKPHGHLQVQLLSPCY